MTGQAWLACADPQPMLEFLKGRISERKLRLFSVACCHRISHLIVDHRLQKVVKIAERFADGQIAEDKLQTAHMTAQSAVRSAKGVLPTKSPEVARAAARQAATATFHASAPRMQDHAAHAASASADAWKLGVVNTDLAKNLSNPGRGIAERARECVYQSAILRDMFIPFHRAAIALACLQWNENCVVRIAGSIYWERRFQDLPILADALEEAGCTDADILNHCRQPGEHVRGCWVVDLLLGKS